MKNKVVLLAVVGFTGFALAQSNTPSNDTRGTTGDPTNTYQTPADQYSTTTPMDQSMKPADVELTRKIREKLVKDDGLSTDAQNVKIISDNGVVTLRGQVQSQKEKNEVRKKAASIA